MHNNQPVTATNFEHLPITPNEFKEVIREADQAAARFILSQDVGQAIDLWQFVDHLAAREGSEK